MILRNIARAVTAMISDGPSLCRRNFYESCVRTYLEPSQINIYDCELREKCPYSEFFWSIFSVLFSRIFSPNAGKFSPRTRKTPNTDTFHALVFFKQNSQRLKIVNHFRKKLHQMFDNVLNKPLVMMSDQKDTKSSCYKEKQYILD